MGRKANVIVNMEAVELSEVKRPHVFSNKIQEVNRFESLSDKLAENSLCYLNYYYKDSKKEFPQHLKLQTVDKYYPYASGGPLYIDEPARQEDVSVYEKKAVVMTKLGLRYLLIKPGMKELDCREALV